MTRYDELTAQGMTPADAITTIADEGPSLDEAQAIGIDMAGWKDPRDFTYFTATFKFDARLYDGNPMLAETPFGRPETCGLGDVFADRDRLERVVEARTAENKRLREALNKIACWDDTRGNAALKNSGSYLCFDEPASVYKARTTLLGFKGGEE